jgi:hypothetical protein
MSVASAASSFSRQCARPASPGSTRTMTERQRSRMSSDAVVGLATGPDFDGDERRRWSTSRAIAKVGPTQKTADFSHPESAATRNETPPGRAGSQTEKPGTRRSSHERIRHAHRSVQSIVLKVLRPELGKTVVLRTSPNLSVEPRQLVRRHATERRPHDRFVGIEHLEL